MSDQIAPGLGRIPDPTMSLGGYPKQNKDIELMAKRAKKPVRRKKSGGSGAATFILMSAVGVGLLIGIAGFESGAAARAALDSTGAIASR